jgi:sulfopyruvate decarboxylase TPP-binding subunit
MDELLTSLGCDYAIGVPDTTLAALMSRLAAVIPVHAAPREDAAVAVGCGLRLGGRLPLVYMKNAGLLTCGDALLSLGRDIGCGLLLLIGWAGSGSDTLPHHVVSGKRTTAG